MACKNARATERAEGAAEYPYRQGETGVGNRRSAQPCRRISGKFFEKAFRVRT